MHPNVNKLLELQKVDQEVASLRRDLDSLPAEEEQRRRRLQDAQQLRDESKEQVDKTEVQTRMMEKAIVQSDEEIKKLTERLNTVKNNAEYQATLFQIESVKKDRDETQEQCLVLLDQIETIRGDYEVARQRAEEEQKVFDEFLAKAEKLRSERGAEVAVVEQRRADVADGIPPDLMQTYERLFEVRGGLAVCPVEGSFCQGCYTNVTTNDVAKLTGGSSVVQCGSCQRILYLAS